MIADEVQSGLGRTGEAYWGFQTFDVVPDIITVWLTNVYFYCSNY